MRKYNVKSGGQLCPGLDVAGLEKNGEILTGAGTAFQ